MHLKTPDGQTAVVVGGSVPAAHDGWMWDLTVPGNNDHDFYVLPAQAGDVPVLVHNNNLECGTGSDVTRVGRWMGKNEYDNIVSTGQVQEGAGGTTYVARPADPAAYARQAKPGTGYAEFDVPTSSVYDLAGEPGWAQIPGPNSLISRLAVRKGLPPLPDFPNASNISDWMGPK